MTNSITPTEKHIISALDYAEVLPGIIWLIARYEDKHERKPDLIAVNARLQKPLETELRILGHWGTQLHRIYDCDVIYFHCTPSQAHRMPDMQFVMVGKKGGNLLHYFDFDPTCSL